MRRVFFALRWEATLQHRHGFYYVSVGVVLILTGLLSQVPDDVVPILIPGFLVNGLFITTFYFFAALVLLEKGQGILSGLVVTPLRAGEYLTAKVITLTVLALVENFLILCLGYGFSFNPVWLVTGLTSVAILYALIGFIAAARYSGVNEFILPSIVLILLLVSPLLDHFGLWRSAVWYLHPVQPALVLLRAAFSAPPVWQIVYGLFGSATWCAGLFYWARQVFEGFIVRTAGS